jgi:hypothetical protein
MQSVRTLLRVVAVTIIVSAGITWFAFGGHPGWTKTSVPVKTVDEVTGIEAVAYEKRFVPGIDFFAAAVLLSGLVFSLRFILPKQTKKQELRTRSVL